MYVVGEVGAVMAADRQQLLLQLELLNIEEQIIDLFINCSYVANRNAFVEMQIFF